MVNEKVCSGDICPECKDGKIALMSSYISEATKDQEPYEGGKMEGEQEICEVDFTPIYFEACEECGKIYDKWFEEARPSLSLERIEEFIRAEMQSRKRKPDYIFQKIFYPSSGVERLHKQDMQIIELAKAIKAELDKLK